MADEQSRKVVIPVVAENQTKSAFQEIKGDAADMAASVEQAGKRAAKGVDGIGDGMDSAAQKFTRAESVIANALQKYIEKTSIAAKSGESLSGAFSQKIELRGLDASKFDPFIQKAREAESALAAVKAQQSQSAGRSAFLDSLTAQTAAIGKSKSELLELQAAQMGVAAQAAPFIARMREAEAGVGKVGMSAAATAAAMRNVPAQFTDIVVSLQAGQAPLTVLLQQGGQLKDMFGGVGEATKAIGGYVLGLINPFTVAAAAVGVLGYAYYQGSQESDNFRKALLLSGNQAGTSVDQLNAMAKAMANSVGTQGAAAAGLAEMAQKSKVGAESLREFTTAAIQWEKATSQAVSETAKQFAELAKDPLKASLALNEQMNILTASVYSQIKALDEQGKKEEAAAVAQKAYSDALKSRSSEAVQNIGWVERAYKAAGNAATWAWDRIAGIGRPETAQSGVEKQIAALESQIGDRNRRAKEDGDPKWAIGTEKLQRQVDAMKAISGAAASVDTFIASMATANKDYIDSTQALDEISSQFAKKDVKRKQELTAAQTAYNTAVEKTKKLYADSPELQGKLDAQKAKYDQAVAGINDRFKDPKGPSSSGGVKISDNQMAGLEAQLVAAKQYAEQLRLVGAAASEANVGERESLKLAAQMEKATDGKTRAKLAEAKAIADALGVQLRSNDGYEKSLKAHQALIDGNYKDADAIGQRAKAQQAANAVYGQGRTEIERMTLATLEHQMAEAEGSDNFDPKYIASLKEKIKSQREWVAALDAYDYKKLDDQLTKSLEASKQELAIQQQGLTMLGMEESQRKVIIAQRKIELDVAKKIAEVEKQYKGRDDEDSLREKEKAKQKIQEQGTIDTQIAIGNIQEEYALKNAEKYNDIFRQGFADFLNNGTQGIKAFGKSLKTTVLTSISDALYKAFAQKFVMNITASISDFFGGAAGLLGGLLGGGSGGGSGGGVMGLISNGSSAYSLYSGQGLLGQGSRYVANMLGWGGSGASTTGTVISGIAPSEVGAGGFMGLNGGYAAAGVMMIPLIAAYLGGMFKEEKQVGSGITGELGGNLYGYQLMRESGGVFDGPDYRYVIAQKEIEKADAEIARLKKEMEENPQDRTNAYKERQLQDLYSRRDRLKELYSGSIEALASPIKALQDAYTGMREGTASRADSLGLDGDSIRAMKVTLGLDEIHPDTGGKGLELTGLTQEEAAAKIQQALAQANEEMARSVLGSWQEVTRDVTRVVWDVVEIDDGAGGDNTNRQVRVAREVTETVTEQVFVMSEYVRAGETAVQALTRLSDSLYSVNTVFDMLGVTLMDTSLAGADMASNIIDAFGGGDKFSAATGNYYDKFYTDQEKVRNQTRLLNDQLKKLGIETMPTSREALREYINGIDLSTEQGRKLYASLLGLVDVFDLIYTSAENIASLKQDLNLQLLRANGNEAEAQRLEREKQIKELEKYNDPELVRMQREVWAAEDKKKAEEEAKQALENAKSLAMNNLQAAIGREKEHWSTFAKTAQEKLTQAASYFDLFTGAAKSLRGSVDDVATYQAAAGMVYIEQALADARRGLGLGDYDQAKTAVDAASSGLVMGNYATQAELDYDKKVLAAQLEELGEFAGVAKTDAQKQIDLANDQIKRLDDTLSYWKDYGQDQIDATLSVTDAVNALFKLLDPKEQERIKKEEAAKAGLGGSGAPSKAGSGAVLGGTVSGTAGRQVIGFTADGRAKWSDGTVEKYAAGQSEYDGHLMIGSGNLNADQWAAMQAGQSVYGSGWDWDAKQGLWVKRKSFAVGTNYVPYDMPADIHQGERIVPVADNKAIISALQNRGSDSSQLSQVVAELKAVKAELQAMKSGQGEALDQAKKIGRVLSNATDGGDAMRVRAVTA